MTNIPRFFHAAFEPVKRYRSIFDKVIAACYLSASSVLIETERGRFFVMPAEDIIEFRPYLKDGSETIVHLHIPDGSPFCQFPIETRDATLWTDPEALEVKTRVRAAPSLFMNKGDPNESN